MRPPAPRLARRRRRRNRILLVAGLAGIAVPTLAASDWSGWSVPIQDQSSAPSPKLGFEDAATNFPGSAFYYVDVPPALRFASEELRSVGPGDGATIQFAESRVEGSAAPAFQQVGSGLDKARALQCLAMAVYYEAASESRDGQRAVAQVVLNRVAHPAYPVSVCGVVFQGSERRTGCQFTFTCDGSLARRHSPASFARAQSVALAALSGEVFAPVGTATHYHTHAVHPYWASSLDQIGSIGAHRFYRWKGEAGRADAFSMTYRGVEPLAAPAPRRLVEELRRVEPARVVPPPPAQIFDALPRANPPVVADPPHPASDTLPERGSVRPEYRRSGMWIRQPGGGATSAE